MNNNYREPQDGSQNKPEDDWMYKNTQKRLEVERLTREQEYLERLNNGTHQSNIEQIEWEKQKINREWINP